MTENNGVRVRFPKGLQDRLKEMADEQGVSMNTLIVALVSGSINYSPTRPEDLADGVREWSTEMRRPHEETLP